MSTTTTATLPLVASDAADTGDFPFPVLPFMTPETLSLCTSLDLDAALSQPACFVCSYPKSGTTWMQNIVYQVLTRGARPEFDHIGEYAPFYEHQRTWDFAARAPKAAYLARAEEIGRQIFNTHLLWHMLPKDSSASTRYIYVVRDGSDACASFFHHLAAQDPSDGGFDGDFKDFLRQWLDGQVAYGRWYDHLRSYLLPWPSNEAAAATDDARVLVLRFEDLKSDLPGAVSKVAAHLGVDLSPDEHKRCVEQSTFSWMRAHDTQFHPRSVAWRDKSFRFIREGRVGGGRVGMDKQDLAAYDNYLRTQRAQLGGGGDDAARCFKRLTSVIGPDYFTLEHSQ